MFATNCRVGEGETDLGSLGGLGDGGDGFGGITAEELRLAVDDHLWRVGVVELQARGVEVLALGELRGGEAVAPAGAVPVVDVLFEDDDVCVGDGLLLLERGEEFVGGRAAGAALGGEKLDEDGGGSC